MFPALMLPLALVSQVPGEEWFFAHGIQNKTLPVYASPLWPEKSVKFAAARDIEGVNDLVEKRHMA
jgi:hypothetical protein